MCCVDCNYKVGSVDFIVKIVARSLMNNAGFMTQSDVLQLQEVGDFEALNCLSPLNLIRSTKLHLTSEPPISCRCCYKLVFFLSWFVCPFYLFPFALLCVLQSISQFLVVVAPPLLQAETWSASISVNGHILVLLVLLPTAHNGQFEMVFFSASIFCFA